MLRNLHIRDYALIEALEVEFDSGLNIITGETGAGKSILLGALGLIRDAIRSFLADPALARLPTA